MAEESGNFFKTSRKGYDRDEVDSFVATKAREDAERADLIAALEARVGKLNSQVEVLGEEAGRASDLESELVKLRDTSAEQQALITDLQTKVATVAEQEEALKLTLASATKTRDEILAAAEAELQRAQNAAGEEADQILERARAEAELLTTTARLEAEERIAASRAEAERIAAANEASATTARTELAERAAAFDAEHAAQISQLETLRTAYTSMADQFRGILETGVDAFTEGGAEVASLIAAAPTPVESPDATPEIEHLHVAAPLSVVADSVPETATSDLPAEDDHAAPAEMHTEPDPIADDLPTVEEPSAPEIVAAEEPPALEPVAAAADSAESVMPMDQMETAALDDSAEPAAVTELWDRMPAMPEPESAEPVAEAAPEPEQIAEPLAELELVAEPEPAVEPAPEPEPVAAATTEPEPAVEPAPEPEPVAAATTEGAEAADDERREEVDLDDEFWNPKTPEEGERGSFYSRRSGRLPRLGADASRNAMSAALGMRIGHEED